VNCEVSSYYPGQFVCRSEAKRFKGSEGPEGSKTSQKTENFVGY
jgi:hypothetical protein